MPQVPPACAGHPGGAAIPTDRAGPTAAPLRRAAAAHKPARHRPGFRTLSSPFKILLAVPALAAGLPGTAHAAAATFVAAATTPLNFGSMVVVGTGTRAVSTTGATTDSGVITVSGGATPTAATFTLTYSRATGDVNVYVLTFQVTMPTVSPVTVNGVQGSLSNFTTDIPGAPTLTPGQSANIILSVCIAASCGLTFHIGATLTVTAGSTGAVLPFSMPIMATVTPVVG